MKEVSAIQINQKNVKPYTMVNKNNKVIIITQAKVIGSRRLPSKTTKQIGDETILSIHLKGLQKSKLATKIVVATTFEKNVTQIIEIVNKCKVNIFKDLQMMF